MKTFPNNRRAVAVAAAIVFSAAAWPAFAQTGSSNKTGSTNSTQQSYSTQSPHSNMSGSQTNMRSGDPMKPSKAGFQAMYELRAARLAIFNGNPQAVQDLLSDAQSSLQAVSREISSSNNGSGGSSSSSSSSNTSSGNNGGGNNGSNQTAMSNSGSSNSGSNTSGSVHYIPIDGQIMLVDSFVDSSAKKSHVDKANQNIAQGKSKEALDELRLAQVDAFFTGVVMPLEPTLKHVSDAKKLVDQKKFYEANLALKAAEDGIRADSFALTGMSNSGTNDSSSGSNGSLDRGNSGSGSGSGNSGSNSNSNSNSGK